MAEPRRVALVSTTPEHCPDKPCRFHARVPEGAAYVGRAAPNLKRSPWANPYKVSEYGRERAVEMYRTRCLLDPAFLAGAEVLAGKDLACKCQVDELCHADVLLEFVSALAEPHEEDPGDFA